MLPTTATWREKARRKRMGGRSEQAAARGRRGRGASAGGRAGGCAMGPRMSAGVRARGRTLYRLRLSMSVWKLVTNLGVWWGVVGWVCVCHVWCMRVWVG